MVRVQLISSDALRERYISITDFFYFPISLGKLLNKYYTLVESKPYSEKTSCMTERKHVRFYSILLPFKMDEMLPSAF